ncbi:hypothetical protein HJC23_000692 [Cyclotella cryptica]|uniref:Uncharacterized protein n=1 Tax=Cyclotella cryptica TaxID=29204 RepID=A0ABD3QAD3_9STRA
MNEMWQEFADALRNCGFDGIELFEVSKVQLSRSVMDLLMPVLATKNITSLSLNRTDFGFDGYLALSTFLNEKTPLLRLELVGNKLDCVAVGIRFFESVGAHPSLQSMKLEDCGIGNDTGLLSALADTFENLSSLDLRGNEIGTKGVEQICNSLSKNPSLERLNLRDNDINDTDVILVAVSLARNTNLRWLCLQDTDITDEGIMRLINSLFNTSSSEAVELSNHTCQIHVGRDKTKLSLGCINWINRYTVIEKNLKEKVAVFLEFKRNLQSKRLLPNPGDIRDHVNDQYLIINERNAQFKKAGKDALLYLTGASPTRQESPRVKFSYNHLRSISYDRKYCKAILTFQEELQQLIASLRNGKDPTTTESCFFVWAKGGTCLKIKLHFFVPLNGQYQLLYRDELLECWKDLSDAIANCPFKQISLLEINNIQIKTAILEVLLPAVAKKDISILSFKTNNLGCDEISVLATFVSSNNTLESLEISGSTLSNPKQAKLLSTAICKSRSLKRLKVEKCALGQNVSVLIEVAKAMNHLLYVYLSGNDIGSNGATVISDVLAKNPPITELYLNDNELMDHDLVPIAQALRSNSNLRCLYIRENLLTSVGDDILTKAMWDGTNFITACASNHTCRIFETKRR